MANEIGPSGSWAAALPESFPVIWSQRDMHLVLGADDLFIVEAGEVDLFAVQVRDDQPVGPWHGVGRAGPGDVIAGPVRGPRHRVLCRRVGDAELRIAPLNSVHALLRDTETPEQVVSGLVSGIESTLRKITRGVQRELPPRDFRVLAGNAVNEFEDGDIVRPIVDVLWVEVTQGRVFHGMDEREYGVGETVCVTRQDWLRVTQESRLRTWTTSQVHERDGLWRALVSHWSRFLYFIDRLVERDELTSLEAVQRATDRDAEATMLVRRGNDTLLLRDSLDVRGVTSGHVDAVTRVLAEMKADTAVPETISSRRDIGDYDQLSSGGWVRTRAIKLEGRWWTKDMGPVAGYWGPDHLPSAFVFRDGGYVVQARWLDDPVRITSDNQFSAGRHVWAVYPRLPLSVTSVKSLLGHSLRGRSGDFWLFGTMAALIGILGLLTPVLSGRVLGDYVASANRSMIVQAGLAIVLSGLVGAAFAIVQNLTVLRLQGSVTASSQTGVWGRLLDLPVTFFQRYSTGRLCTIVLSVKAAQEALSGVVVAATLGLVVVVANLILVFFFNAILALVALALAVVPTVASWLLGKQVLTHERRRYEAEQQLTGMGYEVLSAMSKIRASAAEERAFLRWSDQQRVVQVHALASRRIQDRVTALNAVYPIFALAVLFIVATRLDPQPGLSTLLSFLTSATLLINALLQFTGSVLTAAAIIPMLGSMEPILQAEPEAGVGKAHPGDLSGSVTLRGVSFRYGLDGPLVLDDVSIDVNPGEFVAIVGPSGSGKSTVVRMLLGFAKPVSGAVLYDGQDLGELDLTAVRGQCGVVLQAGALMAGDMRANISAGGNYSDDDLWEAAEMAGLADDIRAMPMGLATVVNESSQGLSGGQVQRLMIARALVNRPRFVIFDEATSALDNPTQRIVADATRALNATRIVVAHRMSTIVGADRIYVMDGGTIVQQGTHEELMADEDGLFAQLARRQEVDA